MQDHVEAVDVRSDLAQLHIDAHVATRAESCYLAVWSDRTDLTEVIGTFSPHAIPVNLDHVPLPRRGEARLVS